MRIFLVTLCVLSMFAVEVNAGCLGRSRRVERRAARADARISVQVFRVGYGVFGCQ